MRDADTKVADDELLEPPSFWRRNPGIAFALGLLALIGIGIAATALWFRHEQDQQAQAREEAKTLIEQQSEVARERTKSARAATSRS